MRTLASQGKFLEAYSRLGNISGAARDTDTPRSQHYTWAKDADYEARFQDAHQVFKDSVLGAIVRKAVIGVERTGPGGRTWLETSDRLLEFLAKGVWPEMFGNVAQEPPAASAPPGWERSQNIIELLDELEAERQR